VANISRKPITTLRKESSALTRKDRRYFLTALCTRCATIDLDLSTLNKVTVCYVDHFFYLRVYTFGASLTSLMVIVSALKLLAGHLAHEKAALLPANHWSAKNFLVDL